MSDGFELPEIISSSPEEPGLVFDGDGTVILSVYAHNDEEMTAIRDELIRRWNYHDRLIGICKGLVERQRYYEEHAHSPGMMPGNQFYSTMFMEVVTSARQALDAAK